VGPRGGQDIFWTTGIILA